MKKEKSKNLTIVLEILEINNSKKNNMIICIYYLGQNL